MISPREQLPPDRRAGDFMNAFAATGAATCSLDFLLSGGGPWQAWATTIGLGCAGGLLLGVVWVFMLEAPSLLKLSRVRWCWAMCAVAYSLWLASSLGVFAKLGSRNHGLALAGLAASAAAGVGIFILAWRFGRRSASSPSSSLRAPGRGSWLTAGGLCAVGAAALIADRRLFPGEHPAAHATLRAASLSVFGFAFVCVISGRVQPRREALGFVAACAASSLPFVVMRGAPAAWARTLFDAPMCAQAVASLRGLTDVDGDGFSSALWGGDCAPWNGAVFPGAEDTPDDGVDQDCSGADAVITFIDPASVPVPDAPSPRSVLLVTVETLRADHLSVYGYPRPTTPALEARASKAMVFERAYTAGAWTSIAIPSLLRGVFARRLRWEPYFETTRGRLLSPRDDRSLREGERGLQVFMLPEATNPPPIGWWLARRGMTTAAVVDDRFSELLDPSTGIAEGFEVFVEGDQIKGRDPDDAVVDLALKTLSELPSDRPWLLWVHLFGPHSPSTRHPGTPTFGVGVTAEYDHEIHFVDAQIDRLIDGALARDPGAAYLVTADHGETLLPNDRMHGFSLADEVIHVPLIMGGEGLPAGRVETPVSTVDIVPTILELTNTQAPEYLDGRSLRSDERETRFLFSDTWRYRYDGALLMEMVGTLDDAATLVHSRTDNTWGLFDPEHPDREPEEVAATVDVQRYVSAMEGYLQAGPLRLRRPY